MVFALRPQYLCRISREEREGCLEGGGGLEDVF